MTENKIKLLIVDDQESVLKGLKMRLALEEDMQIVGEAKDGYGALRIASELQPDIIIMDVDMPKMDGITATKALHKSDPTIMVIMLSIHDDAGLRAQAHAAGAYTYVEKRDGAIILIDEIRNAFESRRRLTHR
jgi:DNA-binding NarL/FixJ family response regulator